MIITNNFQKYIINYPFKIDDLLKKIESNKIGGVVVLKDSKLHGTVTDGDVRRALLEKSSSKNLDNIDVFINTNPIKSFSSSNEEISKYFNHQKVKFIPIISDKFTLNSIALHTSSFINIGTHEISEQSKVIFIAEIGNNHNGDLKLAKEMVLSAKKFGADIVKFQMRNMSEIYNLEADDSNDLGVQYTLDLLEKNQLSDDDLFEVMQFANENGILAMCTPWDKDSAKKLFDNGVKAFKIASADLTNHELIEDICKYRLPIICSTGMSTEEEILETVNLLKKNGSEYIFLHCNSTYPAPLKDLNLKYLSRLEKITGSFVGYSGHERGIESSMAAVSLGAKIVEKHFTFNKDMEGVDHKVSLLPDEFHTLIKKTREIELALGSSGPRVISQGELINRENLSKSIFASKNIKIGDIFSKDNLNLKSPGSGIQPNRINEIIGMSCKQDINKNEMLFENHFKSVEKNSVKFNFNRPWGYPVRYHDLNKLLKLSKPDLIEIHLSYSDLSIDFKKYLNKQYDQQLVVHTPELFESDFILDLCSTDKKIIDTSVRNMQRVIDHTIALKEFFPNSSKPRIVTNMGGFSSDAFLNDLEVNKKINNLIENMKLLKTNGVEIIPQSMPPFPWHMGGQQFHNVFTFPEQINNICDKLNINICLDISHAAMHCSHYGSDLCEYIKTVSKNVSHLHISDSIGVDGEGIQVGEGDINWSELMATLDDNCKESSFIPEVWQSHKNMGEGIWKALSRLEGASIEK